MGTAQISHSAEPIIYPDSDGEPVAENTLQFDWIVTIKGGLDALFRDRPDVFVAGDLLWYPVEGDPKTRVAPDAMVAFGRPKGYRGSYMQWVEDDIAPQVVFEILSPGNRGEEMARKFLFYEKFGVGEYYLYDPELEPTLKKGSPLRGWVRSGDRLVEVARMPGFVSPRLGIRFELGDGKDALTIYHPDGQPFIGFVEQVERVYAEQRRAEQESLRAREQSILTRVAELEAEKARRRADLLAAKLRALGIDPDA